MKLAPLFSEYSELRLGDKALADVTNVTSDSREVREGSVFVAIRGERTDGHQYIKEVVQKGAIALVVEDTREIPSEFQGGVLKSHQTRVELAKILKRFYNYPTRDIHCVGVTGTNGKTSITYMLECIFNAFGWPTGVLGTIGHHLKDKKWNTLHTTPPPEILYKRLNEMKALGAKAFVFEISSHAIHQKRALGLELNTAIFTNLTRDHLDYHKNINDYFNVKEKLFLDLLAQSNKKNKSAIINLDDPYGKNIRVTDQAKRIGYGVSNTDYQVKIVDMDLMGSHYLLKTNRGEYQGYLPMPGEFSVYNAVAAIAAAAEGGVSYENSIKALSEFKGIPGRLQKVKNKLGFHIFIDYAHTPDALKSVLKTLVQINDQIKESTKKGKIITIFGCGGERDQGKRPLMMKEASLQSDLVIVTSDNPRSEDPDQIMREIVSQENPKLQGVKYFCEIDRKKAFKQALMMMKNNDILLVAGKGHENTQLIGDQVLEFNDAKVMRELLSELQNESE